MQFSVIIANYNYGRFLAAAIDSALELRWDDVEVIVVDDASTDDSVAVIQSYGTRVRALLAPKNAGQRAAGNWGFSQSKGDVVVFLDADDVLEPTFAQRVADVWTPSTSKVQVQMLRVDEDGRSLGSITPRFRAVPAPDDIRRWATRTTAYPTPPGSGNAYGRGFLDQVMPVGAGAGEFIDSVLLAAAPLLGDVHTVMEPLVRYRIHAHNDSDLLKDPSRFAREVRRAAGRHRYATALTTVPAGSSARLRRSRELLQFRAAAHRLTPDDVALPEDHRGRILMDAARSVLEPGPERLRDRVAIALWSGAVLLAPLALARSAIRWRYGRA